MKQTDKRQAEEDADEDVMQDSEPDQTSYSIAPEMRRDGSGHAIPLTPRDVARNQGVEKLFSARIPGLPIDADPSETRTDPQTMSNCVEDLLRRLGIRQSPWLDQLLEKWNTLVPPEVSQFATPGKWDSERRILYLYVQSSTKLFEIRRKYLRAIETSVRAFAPDKQIRQVRLMQNIVQ